MDRSATPTACVTGLASAYWIYTWVLSAHVLPCFLASKPSNLLDERQAVKRLQQQGADFVKVYSSLPGDGYFAIADEGKKQNIPVPRNVPEALSTTEASDAGQKCIKHLDRIVFDSSTRAAEPSRQQFPSGCCLRTSNFVIKTSAPSRM